MIMNKKYLYIIGAVAVVIIGAILFSQNKQLPITQSAYVSTDVSGLSETKPTETVDLKSGDTYNLTASYVKKAINGTEYKMLAYNGSIPGPLIKVVQGSEVTINFKNEMEPGDTFSYKLKFPDAGMFWYHPHVREDYQQELGLYGNFLVVPDNAHYWNPVNREVSLFLDDIL